MIRFLDSSLKFFQFGLKYILREIGRGEVDLSKGSDISLVLLGEGNGGDVGNSSGWGR
jgi:hypothetical protein